MTSLPPKEIPAGNSTVTTRAPAEDELEPTAGLSSAASCIKITLLGRSFRPVYTHQCFEGERIRGWSPSDEGQIQAEKTAARLRERAGIACILGLLPHNSYKHHSRTDSRLDVSATLAPSCRHCSVKVFSSDAPSTCASPLVAKENEKNKTGPPAAKRTKFDVQNDDHPMEIDDILRLLGRALPKISMGPIQTVTEDYIEKPIGVVLSGYKRALRSERADSKAGNAEFVVTLANGTDPMATNYHNEVQKLALFFIENADAIDPSSDEGGGFWRVMYLFRRHSEEKYSLAGFVTLFHFHSPFRKPKPGIVMRICQAVVLPLYQRAGHGSRMYQEVYNVADGRYDSKLTDTEVEIVQVNVEDPAPAFVALRNYADYHRLLSFFAEDSSKGLPSIEDGDSFWLPPPESDAVSEAAKLRTTPQQIYIAYELCKLEVMNRKITTMREQGDASTAIELLEKKYRIMVKKRLLKLHREELGACAGKEEQKAKLSDLFEKTMQLFKTLVR